ncbi:TMEM165/GDT1 family protein [Streptomyces sp. SID3343]|uniref:TMEM165/GDT1 family protein n=1 Tax=Streptomyces sp. SID3343 TaxID=2690260 RepID=UPI001369F4AD|nr:TMEM165/GDT1 family protein [Streptomyces sp. SID3343]MYW05098.1 TMEM165/GDT1 family protein [Streptomyces sp. SID3343]
MSVTAAATAFVVIFLAELPDKTMLASLLLGTRLKPLWVWFGVASAFLVHVVIAVTAGGLLSLAPEKVVKAIVAAIFAIGAAVLLFGGGEDDEDADTARDNAKRMGFAATFATGFGLIFVSEWGDITQLGTANLAAKYDPISVGIGAGLALLCVSAIGVAAGSTVLKYVPMRLVKRIAGIVMAVLAVISVVELF